MTPERIARLRKVFRDDMYGCTDHEAELQDALRECLNEIERLQALLPQSDDGEPVTAEWSTAVGLARYHTVDQDSRFGVSVLPCGAVDLCHEPYHGAKGWKGCDVCRMPPIKTRGDARRLAAVFGVKLREGDE